MSLEFTLIRIDDLKALRDQLDVLVQENRSLRRELGYLPKQVVCEEGCATEDC